MYWPIALKPSPPRPVPHTKYIFHRIYRYRAQFPIVQSVNSGFDLPATLLTLQLIQIMEEEFPEDVNKMCEMSDSIKFNCRESSPPKANFRQIAPGDSFPCYNCGNDRMLMIDCQVCNKTGFLDGSNPMVRLIQQIIDSKMRPASIHQNDFRVSRDLTTSVTFPLSLHENFVCDECCADPIVGRRYHCSVCGDYDLCESCNVKTCHPHNLTLAGGEEDNKKMALDRKTQRSTLMKSCRMSINKELRDSQM